MILCKHSLEDSKVGDAPSGSFCCQHQTLSAMDGNRKDSKTAWRRVELHAEWQEWVGRGDPLKIVRAAELEST